MAPAEAWTLVDNTAQGIGECPLWDDRCNHLYWIDVQGRRLFRRDMSVSRTTSWTLSGAPGSIALRKQTGLLIAFRNGLALFDPETGVEIRLDAAAADFAIERFNDGACDRAGRFWVGSLDRALAGPAGGLFCLEPDGTFSRKAGGVAIGNGIAWSPDNRTLYHVDSLPGQVLAYDYDLGEGALGERRVFADFKDRTGTPDGCAIDAEGGLWVAAAGAGELVRFHPSGRQIDAIACPVGRVTSLTFGGPDLRTAFVTSMRHGAADDDRLAGVTMAIPMPVAGLPLPRFGG